MIDSISRSPTLRAFWERVQLRYVLGSDEDWSYGLVILTVVIVSSLQVRYERLLTQLVDLAESRSVECALYTQP
jgi:hypothetical protein